MSNSDCTPLCEIIADGAEGEIYVYSLTKIQEESERFGVRIRLQIGNEVFLSESGALFLNEERATRFLAFLARHLVTPYNLPYIIEDCLEFD